MLPFLAVVALVAVVQEEMMFLTQYQELQTQAAEVVVGQGRLWLELAVPALLSCPIPCQKAQYLLLRLLAHLEAQPHPQLLTTW